MTDSTNSDGTVMGDEIVPGAWTRAALDARDPRLQKLLKADDVKAALREIRLECTSGYVEMGAVDEAWKRLFGDSPDAPWKAQL